MKISDAEKVNRMEPLDMLPLVTENGFRSIFAEDLARSVFSVIAKDEDPDNAGLARAAYFEFLDEIADTEMRRNTFRGKLLGTEVTDEQYARIADGSFKGFFCGDYWRINGYTWRIADFDYWYNSGPSDRICNEHHLTIFPDEALIQSTLRDIDVNDYGFLATKFFSTSETDKSLHDKVRDEFLIPAFGNSGHILLFYDYITNTVVSGTPTNGVWRSMQLTTPTEPMIFGSITYMSTSYGEVMAVNGSVSRLQLALLRTTCDLFISTPNHETYWGRDVNGTNRVTCIDNNASPGSRVVNEIEWIRPVFGLK